MAIAFPSALNVDYTVGLVTNASSNTTIVGNKPSGASVGDVLEFALKMNNSANPLVVTPPAGLTLIGSNVSGSGAFRCFIEIYIFVITDSTVLAALPSSWTFTVGTANVSDDALIIRRITGVDNAAPYGAVNAYNNVTTNTPINLTITTTVNNSTVMHHVAAKGANTLLVDGSGAPTGTTLIQNTRSRNSSSGVCYGAAYEQVATPQAVGARTWAPGTTYLSAPAYWSTFSYELKPSATATIIDVNGDEVVRVGSTGNTWSNNNYTPTTVTIGGKAGSDVTASNFDFPDRADGQVWPGYGAQTLTGAGGGDTASISITLREKTAEDYVTLTSANTAAGYIGHYISSSAGDQITFLRPASLSVTRNAVAADGGISSDYIGTQTMWHWQHSAGAVSQLSVTTDEEGVISVALAAMAITARTITIQPISIRGL